MFIPNAYCTVRRRNGTNLYGKAIYTKPQTIRCGVVRLSEMSSPTSVRTDSSASRGSAKEERAISRLLVPANTKLVSGDEVTLGEFVLTVNGVQPRYAINGKIDHWQVELIIGADLNNATQLVS